MATLTDAVHFATDVGVRLPMIAGITQAAVNIMSEDGTTSGHELRVALASQVLHNPDTLAQPFTWAVSSNATVVDEWTSGNRTGAINDFAFAIASVWNAMAGDAQPPA